MLLIDPEAPRNKSLEDCLIHCVDMPGGRPFVFIIDEWDAMIREAKNDADAQNAYLNLLGGWFKNNNFTPRVVAAACLRDRESVKAGRFNSKLTLRIY